jgi:hypothetical protein
MKVVPHIEQTNPNIEVTPDNVEAITLRILEESADIVLLCGFDSPQQAYDFINQTSDIISGVFDSADLAPFPYHPHEEMVLDHINEHEHGSKLRNYFDAEQSYVA